MKFVSSFFSIGWSRKKWLGLYLLWPPLIRAPFFFPIFCGVTLLFLSPIMAADIVIHDGNWNPSITASNLQGGAGSHLVTTLENTGTPPTIDVFNTGGSWAVHVNRDSWTTSVEIWVKRIGVDDATIWGGTTYRRVETTQGTEFFRGIGDISNIQIQIKLEGLTINDPPVVGGYLNKLYFTVSTP